MDEQGHYNDACATPLPRQAALRAARTARTLRNGQLHMGHAVNKILKDMIVKARQPRRLRRALRAGLGLPRPADREPDREDLRPHITRDDMQAKSRAYATEQIALQMADFKRLGVLATGSTLPHDGLRPTRPARSARSSGDGGGFVYRGLKPVYWCFDCGSSLAEFEIEYADKTSPTLGLSASSAPSPDKLAAPSRPALSSSEDAFAVSGPPRLGPPAPTRR
jgi:isoleucyl-tRNA synthetase